MTSIPYSEFSRSVPKDPAIGSKWITATTSISTEIAHSITSRPPAVCIAAGSYSLQNARNGAASLALVAGRTVEEGPGYADRRGIKQATTEVRLVGRHALVNLFAGVQPALADYSSH